MDDRRAFAGAAMIAASAAGYATLPTFARVAFDHGSNPLGVLVLRFAVAAPVVGAWAFARHPTDGLRRIAPVVVPASVLYLLQTLTFFEAVARMGAVLSVLILFSYPLLVALAAPFVLDERFGRARLAAVAVGSAGVALSVGFAGSPSTVGILLAACSAILFTAFFLVVRRALDAPGVDGVSVTALVYAVCVVGFGIAAVPAGATLPGDASGWAAVAAIAFLGTIVANVLLFVGMSRLSATAAGLLTAIEPPLAVLVAAVALSEPVRLVQVLGMVLVVAAIAGLARTGLTPDLVQD